jgi:hypothetical protein
MKREQHPEFAVYLQQKQRVEVARRVVGEWIASGEPLRTDGQQWHAGDARELLYRLQQLFTAYNQVLWQAFPYCRACGGGCCVPGASHVTLADAVAMALLALPFPERPLQVAASGRDCIYLEGNRCSWPQQWRPLKCWSFYCLGSGAAELDASDSRYGEITAALQELLDSLLPEALRSHGSELRAALSDPIAFASLLVDVLQELIVEPLAERYPALYDVTPDQEPQPGDSEATVEATLSFIVRAGEALWEVEEEQVTAGFSREQLLAGLEQLEWIVTARPGNAALLLGQLVESYAGAPAPGEGERPTLAYELRGQALALLQGPYSA